MKKTFIFVLLLLSLFAYKVNAAPNTGNLPENGVKVNFNANGTYSSVEGSGWAFNQSAGSLTLTKGEVVVTLSEYVFKDGNEIIGFSWTIEGATAVLWVKHGRTSEVYGEGMEGEFTTSDRKGVSNAVFLIEIIDDEDEELDDEEDQDDEDEELDDEEDQDDEDEELDEEEQDDEDEELDDEEDQDDEDEELDDEEDQDDEDEELDEEEEQDDEEEELDDEEERDDEDEELDEEEEQDDEDEELDDEEDQDDEDEELDEEEQDDEEEVVDEEEEQDDEEEVLGDDEENEEEIDEEVEDEEEEVLGESDEDEEAAGDGEELPDTSDASKRSWLCIRTDGIILVSRFQEKSSRIIKYKKR
jgi:hypothetical protein